MELRVAATPGYTLPPGCFVGVRMGDMLKQGRYEPSRCYHFPNVDRRRNAKIDIYRHVGSCVLAVDPEEGKSQQEVSVSCSDPTFPALKLNVDMLSTKAPLGVDLSKREREEKARTVTSQAKDYLANFAIEEKLSAAVKALLKEQPEDPTEFICRHLKESKITAPPPRFSPAPRIGAPVGKPTGQIVLSQGKFAEYYKANNLPNVAQDCYNAIYAKFPAASSRPQAPPSKADYTAAASDVDDLRRKARNVLIGASKDGGLQAALKESGIVPSGGPAQDNGFGLRPSVGTWLSPRHTKSRNVSSEEPQRSACVMRTAAMMGPAFYSMGMPNTVRIF